MQRAPSTHPRGHWVRIATFLVALVAAALLPPADAAPASAGALDHIRQTGKLVLGYRADARPFSFRDDAGKAAGYAVALCEKIAEQLKTDLGLSALAVEWVPVTLEDRFRAIQERRIDLLCGADSATLERRQAVAFSIPIFAGGIGAMLRADASHRLKQILNKGQGAARPLWRATPAQILEQQTFSVIGGTTSEKWLAGRLGKFQIAAKVVPVDGYDAGIRRVLDRSSNVFFADRAILLDAAARSPSKSKLIVLERQFTHEPVALALARGDEDLRLSVDRTLSRLYASDDLRLVYAKWFGELDEDARTFFRMSALPE